MNYEQGKAKMALERPIPLRTFKPDERQTLTTSPLCSLRSAMVHDPAASE